MIFFLLLFCPFLSFGAILEVAAEIERTGPVYEGEMVRGILTIVHPDSLSLDGVKATMEGKPLQIEEIKTVPIGSSTANVFENHPSSMTLFHFSFPGKKAGLHWLPPLTVQLGHESESTATVPYEIMDVSGKLSPKETSEYLMVTPLFEGKNPLYPGEKARLGYRYLFRGDLRLTEEILPLLDADRLVKIGNPDSRESRENAYSVLDVWQTVEADRPGKYTFPAARLAGVLLSGKSVEPKSFRLESAPFTLDVLPFPEEGKPPFFTGASGSFTASSEFFQDQSTGQNRLGIDFSITGEGSLSRVQFPNLCCQPDWSGVFEIERISPPLTKEKKKSWKLYLKNSSPTHQIPPIYFAFFDPNLHAYRIVKTNPLPLKTSPKTALASLPSALEKNPVPPLNFLPPSYLTDALSRAGIAFFVFPVGGLFFRYRKALGIILLLIGTVFVLMPKPGPYTLLKNLEADTSPPEIRQKKINDALAILFEGERSYLTTPETPLWIAECLRFLGENAYAKLWQEKGYIRMPRHQNSLLLSPQELQAFLGLAFCFTFLFWQKKGVRFIALFMASLLFFQIAWQHYLVHPKGVIVEASFLFSEKNGKVPLFRSPIASDTLVDLIEGREGKWLKIRTKDGMVGFIPKNKVRLV